MQRVAPRPLLQFQFHQSPLWSAMVPGPSNGSATTTSTRCRHSESSEARRQCRSIWMVRHVKGGLFPLRVDLFALSHDDVESLHSEAIYCPTCRPDTLIHMWQTKYAYYLKLIDRPCHRYYYAH